MDTADFFNGASGRPYKVAVDISVGKIILSDEEKIAGAPLEYPLAQCHYTLSPTKLFVYLTEGFDTYISVDVDTTLYKELYASLKTVKPSNWYNRLLHQNKFVLVAILLALAGGIYFLLEDVVPLVVVPFIPVKQEAAMGEELYRTITRDATIDTTLSDLSTQFIHAMDLSDKYQLQVTVLEDDRVNAFELPGGHIIVYSGILPYLHSPEEFVALLAHEASHINKRHSLRYLVSRIGSSLALSIILNDAGGATKTIMENADGIYSLAYSRNLERQADEEGLKLMVKNKVDPTGMKKLMQDLLRAQKDLPASASFLSNHPLTKERISNVDGFVEKNPGYTTADHPTLTTIWNQIKTEDDKERAADRVK